ncbi:imidazole glycerol phosphate synthase cyclase subunit [Amylibacter sp.]|nr:imidazole glycerol phosphate synthase cyclase subunit [Amylibacter sp.]
MGLIGKATKGELTLSKIRLIARLDIKGPNLIKSIRFEGLRVLGNPQEFAQKYYEEGIDEILYVDTVATLYERVGMHDLVKKTAQNVFIPITVAGGIRSVQDVDDLLRSGADKIAINTAAVKNPDLISQISKKFGSQCMVLSIEACKQPDGKWEAYTDNGREHSNLEVVEWAMKAEKLGAGEILLTSVDFDGTLKGFDYDLIKLVSENVSIPVIASGGFGGEDHFKKVVEDYCADAVAVGSALHYDKFTVKSLKDKLRAKGLNVR